MRNSNSNHGHNLVEKLELPQDIVLGVPVRTKTFAVQIEGKELNIQEYRKDLLIIRGKIERMQFLI